MSGEGSDGGGSGWWKPVLIAGAAAAAAAVVWGWLKPAPEVPPEGEEVLEERVEAALIEARPAGSQAPAWVKPTVLWTIAVIVAIGVGLLMIGLLAEVVTWVLLALFFSFALEPAANRLMRRGWRPGTATGLLLALTFVLLIGVGLIFVGAIIRGAIVIADRLPEWATTAGAWLEDTFGIEVATDGFSSGAEGAVTALEASGAEPIETLLGFTASLIGGIFAMFTVGMFIFYMVAQGPRFKRAVLSFFPRQRQEELVSIWEAAIDKTGGYFYSKLLLALINGGLFFIVLVALGVPGAAALATFQGVVAEFIPIVGTYIAAIVPLVIAFMSVGMPETLILLIYVLIYQQVENYLLAPRLQARTMQLHPAIAFGAALAGGAIGGLLWAFLAIPFAATVQASASLWFERHEVMETELTVEQVRIVKEKEAKEERSVGERVGGFLRSSRGWLRRGKSEAPEPDEPAPAEQAPSVSPLEAPQEPNLGSPLDA
ncbi:MAG TPA: AI-2E family transporter [Actinomycetota bacterium]|nr:AI-2E family transporter [Actinomycetota bacterium]